MPHRLEITLKSDLTDAEGEGLKRKARDYFGIQLNTVRTVHILTIDGAVDEGDLSVIQEEIFTNPVTQVSAYTPLDLPFDWGIWVGFRPGVRDNPGATAMEAICDVLGTKTGATAVYTSKRYCIQANGLTESDVDQLAGALLANDIIQQWRIYSTASWDPTNGVGIILPRVKLDHVPTVTTVAIDSDDTLQAISDQRNLALNPADIPTIRAYFLDPDVLRQRESVGLREPTDVELEYISQGRSDHCNHNTFQGRFHYRDMGTGEETTVDNPFKACIQAPTLALKETHPWVVSVLWDNAGVAKFDDDNHYVITGETHNSPSNMEAYGGAITGIVGVYRDPMGTGKGSRLIMGSYGFCVGHRDYDGPLKPRLHPRRLLDGVIEGVRDGGNKSGIPTPFGQVTFHDGYMGKCLVFVTALGMMPAVVDGGPSDQKTTSPGDLVIVCGGRVGKDGIHGVTASSEVFSEHTPAGHVQIGDPYTQKKMHDFLLEARDQRLIRFVTDNGGGGLSSSVGESARFSNGVEVQLDQVPLKYDGLDQWEIWVSESQERMTMAVAPADVDRFMALARLHAVEATVIGTFTDTGKLHITWQGETCAYVDMDLLTAGFPQWAFDAEWRSPEMRGMAEPVIGEPTDHTALLRAMLARPNLCAKNWVSRQYDHEVQGTSVIKPLMGVHRDIPSDAAVLRPVLTSERGLAFSQSVLPFYSAIDARAMVACTMDEAVRRLVAVGADPNQIGGVDNFCWPSIQYDPERNPDGRFKAAQLVRACLALKDICEAYEIPLLSGKDSMYVDGHLAGEFGERHKVSALETMQFSATSVLADVAGAVTMDTKAPGDRVYLIGTTRNELGASELYDHFHKIGRNVPRLTEPAEHRAAYQALHAAMGERLVASAHGIYRGGLAVHLTLAAMAGDLGMAVDADAVPGADALTPLGILYSESPGRLMVTVAPPHVDRFESIMAGIPMAAIGEVLERPDVVIRYHATPLVELPVAEASRIWHRPFGDLI